MERFRGGMGGHHVISYSHAPEWLRHERGPVLVVQENQNVLRTERRERT